MSLHVSFGGISAESQLHGPTRDYQRRNDQASLYVWLAARSVNRTSVTVTSVTTNPKTSITNVQIEII